MLEKRWQSWDWNEKDLRLMKDVGWRGRRVDGRAVATTTRCKGIGTDHYLRRGEEDWLPLRKGRVKGREKVCDQYRGRGRGCLTASCKAEVSKKKRCDNSSSRPGTRVLLPLIKGSVTDETIKDFGEEFHGLVEKKEGEKTWRGRRLRGRYGKAWGRDALAYE